DYLLKPAPTVRKLRRGAGIAVLIVYVCLLLLLAFTYFRLAHTVITNPGFTPRSPQWHAQNRAKRRRSRSNRARTGHPDLEKQNRALGEQPASNGGLPASPYVNASSAYGPVNDAATPGLHEFYNRDIFTCESDGRPIWCSACLNWKPDRAHHCREVGSRESRREMGKVNPALVLALALALATHLLPPYQKFIPTTSNIRLKRTINST
ncbi:MAG: hypothetical protein Q9179_002946, partial [Wetmoreana sp. 5 TL-2023]